MDRLVLVEGIIEWPFSDISEAETAVNELFDDDNFELNWGDLVIASDLYDESYIIYDSWDVIAEWLSEDEMEEEQNANWGTLYKIVWYYH